MTPSAIRAIRGSLTQEQFAKRLRVSLALVRAWERGARIPRGPAVLMLETIRDTLGKPTDKERRHA